MNEPSLTAQLLGWVVLGAYFGVVGLVMWLGELRREAEAARRHRRERR